MATPASRRSSVDVGKGRLALRCRIGQKRSSDRFDTAVARSPPPDRHPTGGPAPVMPSLIKFLVVLLVLGIVSFAGMYYLANYVEPKPREITIRVPSDRFREQ
jgi:hypothetical protein